MSNYLKIVVLIFIQLQGCNQSFEKTDFKSYCDYVIITGFVPYSSVYFFFEPITEKEMLAYDGKKTIYLSDRPLFNFDFDEDKMTNLISDFKLGIDTICKPCNIRILDSNQYCMFAKLEYKNYRTSQIPNKYEFKKEDLDQCNSYLIYPDSNYYLKITPVLISKENKIIEANETISEGSQ